MKLSQYSRNIIMQTFQTWDVPKDFADPFYNYLVHGFGPGSCFTAVLANDFYNAIGSSHPNNTVNAFKSLSGWIREYCPTEACGSYEAVKHWLEITSDERRAVLEKHELVYSEKDETFLIIKGEPVDEPVLY